jgi:hypothetical protein
VQKENDKSPPKEAQPAAVGAQKPKRGRPARSSVQKVAVGAQKPKRGRPARSSLQKENDKSPSKEAQPAVVGALKPKRGRPRKIQDHPQADSCSEQPVEDPKPTPEQQLEMPPKQPDQAGRFLNLIIPQYECASSCVHEARREHSSYAHTPPPASVREHQSLELASKPAGILKS